jgi:SOS response regulatory protein OraA/RecX
VPGDASSSPSAEQPVAGEPSADAAAPGSPVILTVTLKGAGGEGVKLLLSDGSSCVLAAEVYAKAGLGRDSPLDPGLLAILLRRSERLFARSRALALVARAAQTRRGLARKLAARGFSPGAVRHAVERMAELGYVDDHAFAEAWVRSRLSLRGQGWKALCRGLLGRGVPRAVADEVLADMYPPEAERERAVRYARGMTPQAAARALGARGFRTSAIAAAVRSLRGTASPPAEE